METKTDLNFEKIKNNLLTLFKSPNPFSIYINSKAIKDDFSNYLTYISKQVSIWFDLREDGKIFIVNLYKRSSYEKIWEKNMFLYLLEAKYFDICTYENYKFMKENKKDNFEWMLEIFNKIVYIYKDKIKTREIEQFFSLKKWKDIKVAVDIIISWYYKDKKNFLNYFCEAINHLNDEEKLLMQVYMYREMINIYFSNVKNLFYTEWASNFQSKENFLKLKWNLKIIDSISEEWKNFNKEIQELYDLKEVIIKLQDNLFSSFLLPIVYHRLSEELNVSIKDLHKVKYLLLYIFSENYSEYKKIYNFFTQLEAFLSNWPDEFIKKLKLSFSLILISLVLVILWFFYIPIWVFLGFLVIFVMKFIEVFLPWKYFNHNWNIWLKFFAVAICCISRFYWFQNFDNLKNDFESINKKTKIIWTTNTIDALSKVTKYIYGNTFRNK